MQFIGSLLAARTWAAASSAETFLGLGSFTFLVFAGAASVVVASGVAPLAIAALASVASSFVSYGPCSWPLSFATTQNRPLASFFTCRPAGFEAVAGDSVAGASPPVAGAS